MGAIAPTLRLDDTYGSLFLGGILTTALWGASVIQLYLYVDRYSSFDGWWIKAPVLLIWMLDTAHQAIFMHILYTYLVSNFSNLLNLNHFNSEGASLIMITALLNLLVQSVFIMRIWHLSKRNFILTGLAALFILAHFTSTVLYFAVSINFTSLTQFTTIFSVERALNSIGFLTDTVIAGILAYLLYTSRTGYSKTNSTIGFLILYFISTGFLMDLCSLAALITGVLLPETFVFLTILLIYPKLYTNSVLALLNTRQRRGRSLSYDAEDSMSSRDSLWVQSHHIPHSRNVRGSHVMDFQAIEIKVDAETVVRRETEESDRTSTESR